MADDAVSRATSIMMPNYKLGFVDAMAKKDVEWYWLDKNDCFLPNQGGRAIEWRARLAVGTPFAFLGGMEEHTPVVQDDFEVATLDWAGLAHAFVATYRDKKLCKGKWEIIKLLKGLTNNMMTDWRQEWGSQFHDDGARNSSAFEGLKSSMGTSAQTYAGLSQTTFANWDCQRIDATGFAADPTNFLQQAKLLAAVGEAGGRDRNMLDLFLCTQTDYRVVCQSEFAKFRYERDEEMHRAGFENIACWGVPLAWSDFAVSTKIMGLNSKLFKMYLAGDSAIETGTHESIGFPFQLTQGYSVSLHQLVNENPRASVILYNTTS